MQVIPPMNKNFVPCPNCSASLLTEEYENRYGQCWTCYEREMFTLGERIQRALN